LRAIDGRVDSLHSAFDVDESEMNLLGYAILRTRLADAVRLFELNVALFPSSANVHDSLGEALLLAGDTVRAIASYERALALAPSSESLKERLRTLRGAPRK
jgi:tetratricopeptide (TPR) repeat protein